MTCTKGLTALVLVCVMGLISLSVHAEEAAELTSAVAFGGPLGKRLKLTSDWGGKRDELAEKGVTVDFNTVGVVQGVVDGGVRHHDRWGGSSALMLKVNFDQMGVMPGAFLDLKAEAKFGQFANGAHRDGHLAQCGRAVPDAYGE